MEREREEERREKACMLPHCISRGRTSFRGLGALHWRFLSACAMPWCVIVAVVVFRPLCCVTYATYPIENRNQTQVDPASSAVASGLFAGQYTWAVSLLSNPSPLFPPLLSTMFICHTSAFAYINTPDIATPPPPAPLPWHFCVVSMRVRLFKRTQAGISGHKKRVV
jgi:hypothetical protein